MDDDRPQKSPEFLDETKPERGERSLFERLLGKESDEEKLRRKLNEELKEAARKRAEQFEEERRVEEAREVSETKKLKKRWRAKLVEKSKQLLAEAEEHDDSEPLNGYEIAKLMVAERIVKLHDMLTDEALDLRRSEIKSLKIHIDFMGLLSEKLDKPDLDVPEEIEGLYQTIAASVAETTGEDIARTAPQEIEPHPVEAPPVSDTDVAYNTFASSIVQAIRRTIRSAEAPSSSPGGHSSSPDGQNRSTERQTSPSPEAPQAATEKLASVVKNAALSAEVIRGEIFHADTARRLADIVEKAETMKLRPTTETPKTPQVKSAVPEIALAGLATKAVHQIKQTPGAVEKKSTKAFDIDPNRKIKHMTELELVTLAKTVQTDSGRLLSDLYTHGEIDREGLIKVLESYNKGRDYRSELTFRREKWRRHRESSPEYLAQPSVATTPAASPTIHAADSSPDKREKLSVSQKTSPIQSFATAAKGKFRDIGRSLSSKVTEKTKAEAKRLVQETGERIKRQGHIALLFASVLLVIILLLIVINLNIR